MTKHSSSHPAWRRYLRFWGSNIADDVDDELRFHVDMRVAEYIARGLPADAARRLAEQRFGNAARAQHACVHIQTEHARSERRLQVGAALQQDIMFAVRVLRRQALPSIVAAACIALGIGATTAMFSIGNTLLLRPLPYPNGDRLVSIGSAHHGIRTAGATVSSLPDFLDWRMRQHSFTEVAAVGPGTFTVVSGEPLRVGGATVTINLFRALGAGADVGRLFENGDDSRSAPATAIVSRGFADRVLGGARSALGKRILIGGVPRTVIGVLANRWAYPSGVDIWLPLPADDNSASRGDRHFDVIAELRPGVTAAAADRDIRSIGTELARDYPDKDAMITPYVEPLRERFVGSARGSLLALSCATLLILLVACANVAALQLARVSARSREIAVRMAIGAQRGRILGQLLTESVLLGLVGGVAGLLLAIASKNVIARAVAANAPAWMTFDIDARALGFAIATSVAAAIIFGLAPALRLMRIDAGATLHGGTATADRTGARLQRMFVVIELALSVILVVGAGLAIESVIRLRNVPLGFDPQHMMTFRISMQGQRYDDRAERVRVVSALQNAFGALPEVGTAAATTYAPVSSCCSQFGTQIEGQPTDPAHQHLFTGNIVTPGFFTAMRIPILAGRDFSSRDGSDAPHVVVISQTFAKQFWPSGDALGHRIDTGSGMSEIVGVVGDIKQGRLVDHPEPQFYRPYSQDPWSTMGFVLRVRGDDTTHIAADVRRVARSLDPMALPVGRITTMARIIDNATASNRVLGELLALFAAAALVLAAIGIYAIMSFFVSRRTRELGVRIALGATPGEVLAMVLGQAGLLAVTGGLLGMGGGVLAARALAHTLYGVSAAEPRIYVVAAVIIALAAFAASVGPARRASAVDPLVALRTE